MHQWKNVYYYMSHPSESACGPTEPECSDATVPPVPLSLDLIHLFTLQTFPKHQL